MLGDVWGGKNCFMLLLVVRSLSTDVTLKNVWDCFNSFRATSLFCPLNANCHLTDFFSPLKKSWKSNFDGRRGPQMHPYFYEEETQEQEKKRQKSFVYAKDWSQDWFFSVWKPLVASDFSLFRIVIPENKPIFRFVSIFRKEYEFFSLWHCRKIFSCSCGERLHMAVNEASFQAYKKTAF